MNNLTNRQNYTYTENGALSHKSTKSAVYDMFAVGGAYRKRSKEDCILLFKNALEEDVSLALKTLFYLRDIRGGQGERRFFRVCFNWLANEHPDIAKHNLKYVSEYGRWDDLIYSTFNTPLELDALRLIKHQLALDLMSETPSLLGKWLPSENASSETTKKMGKRIRKYLRITSREYRKVLSTLRTRINILEKLMSEQRWNEIEFDKIPSKAGLIYRNTFLSRDELSKRYKEFIDSKHTTVNANLYPYEIVNKVTPNYFYPPLFKEERAVLEKYWNNLPDYFNGKQESMICVVDTSGSMHGTPMDVAISLGIYCGERNRGPFHNYYISFSKEPRLVKIEGMDFVDKVQRIYRNCIVENTDLVKVFSLLKSIALMPSTKREDIPKTVVIISDMQIDSGLNDIWEYRRGPHNNAIVKITKDNISTEMEKIRREWAADGLEMPRLVYWNVDSRGRANILDLGPNVSYVSGFSPVIFKTILTGKSGYELMLEVLTSSRYANIY